MWKSKFTWILKLVAMQQNVHEVVLCCNCGHEIPVPATLEYINAAVMSIVVGVCGEVSR